MPKGKDKSFDNPKLWKLVYNWYKSGIKYRDGRSLPEMWDKFEQYYDNEYWNDIQRPEYLTAASDNLLFEDIETMLPVITSRPPRPEITPIPKDTSEEAISAANEYAKKVQRELITIWHDTRMMGKLRTGFRENGIKGTYIHRSLYDKDKHEWQETVCDMLSIIPNPTAFDMEGCYKSWFIYAPVMSVQDIYKRYGVWVEPESQDEAELGQYVGMLKKGVRGVQRVLNNSFGNDSSTKDKRTGFAVLIECWMADGEAEMEEVLVNEYDDDGSRIEVAGSKQYESTGNGQEQIEVPGSAKYKKKSVQRRKYPNGKVVTIARGDKNRILEVKTNSYGPRFPFMRTVNYERAGDFYGTSEGKNIEDQNLMLNQIISNVNDNARFTGNPQKEIVRSAKVKGNSDEPGAVYESDTGQGVRNIDPPSMPSYIHNFLIWLQGSSDRKTGINDSMRGISQSGDSGIKTQALIAQATGRLQPKTASFVEFSRQWYEHKVYVIKNFYPDNIIQQDKDEQGKPTYEEFNPSEGRELDLKVDVSQISMLPFDNYAEFEEAQLIYSIPNPKTQLPSMSLDQLIETAPALRDKQRIKAYNADLEEQVEIQQAIQEIMDNSADQQEAEIALVQYMSDNPEMAEKIAEMAGIPLPEEGAPPELEGQPV